MGNIAACCNEADRASQESKFSLEIDPDDDSSISTDIERPNIADIIQFASKAVPEDDFLQRFKKSLEVELTTQDCSRLTCKVALAESMDKIMLMYQKKAKHINFREIKEILHTVEQLSLVDSQAGVNTSIPCVAIQLLESNNCIPLFFKNIEEKLYFVEAMQRMLTTSQQTLKSY
ncbi:hypothetical protein IE077_000147 [Cardiosporidium cionae]|uniref:ISP1 C-terminal domain-containing protein n=1 Tax=Cardiosporidium cionae TaxID=476202 RepID=A0ABQ7JE52_9APIC|nr:hypothetical protein IE077_000147 [Cardiosporidium cionae]|eukprot:KAF8821920.1 hypothetical protein IE077_000147 [Cardiosporidium cionae]